MNMLQHLFKNVRIYFAIRKYKYKFFFIFNKKNHPLKEEACKKATAVTYSFKSYRRDLAMKVTVLPKGNWRINLVRTRTPIFLDHNPTPAPPRLLFTID